MSGPLCMADIRELRVLGPELVALELVVVVDSVVRVCVTGCPAATELGEDSALW